RVDSVMLERLLENGAVQAGIYAQAYRLMEAGNMVAFLFAGLLLPIFSHMIKSKSNIEPLLKTSTSLMLVPALGVAIVYIFNNVEIMDALYKYNARESAQVGVFLMVSFVGMCVSYNFGALLTANGNLGALNKLAASAMAFNIILNLVLIPKMQANGAAIASMTTQLLMALGQILLAMKLFKISINKAFIFRLIIFIILTILSSMWVSKLDWDLDLPMSHTLASAFLAFVLALFTKAINIGDLLAIWRQQD
ncbi:MAG: polysaccharide biosynthesis C-terminal domain-containing protein, partial [Bacteroidota bacterium]